MRQHWIVMAWLLACWSSGAGLSDAYAQTTRTGGSLLKSGDFPVKPTGFMSKLIDPSRLELSQSYEISFWSSGNRSMNTGLYLNTLRYQARDNLFFQTRVGLMHQPFGGQNGSGLESSQLFLQQAMIQYRPRENMIFTLDYQSIPAPMFRPYSRIR